MPGTRISRCAVHNYDISDLKQRELDLNMLIEQQANKNQSLILYAAMIESMDDMVIVTDMMGYIFYVNRSFVKIFGYSPAEVKKQHITMLQDPTDPFAMDTDAFYVDKKKVWNGSFTGVNRYKMRIRTLLKSSPVVYRGPDRLPDLCPEGTAGLNNRSPVSGTVPVRSRQPCRASFRCPASLPVFRPYFIPGDRIPGHYKWNNIY